MGGTFGEAVFLRELAADEVLDLRVFRPSLQGSVALASETGGIAEELAHHGRESVGFGAIGIRLENCAEGDLGIGELLGVNVMLGQEELGAYMVWIECESGLD